MAKRTVKGLVSQSYPRITNEDDRYHGYLDESRLHPHIHKPTAKEMKRIVVAAITQANKKSSRAILNIDDQAPEEHLSGIYQKEGRKLFKYFKDYCGDPASTAYICMGKHYTVIAREQFRNRTLQKERMNSGWRYQFIAKEGAITSRRFLTVSDIGANEADFNATIEAQDVEAGRLNIYTSVKNRENTISGGAWPKMIRALEEVAKSDKNRSGPYICVFGLTMAPGTRSIKAEQKTKAIYSPNVEVWMSDFFWPFFTNYSYEEIAKAVLSVLNILGEQDSLDVRIPEELLESFGECCRSRGLLDGNGYFNDPARLLEFFVRRKSRNS